MLWHRSSANNSIWKPTAPSFQSHHSKRALCDVISEQSFCVSYRFISTLFYTKNSEPRRIQRRQTSVLKTSDLIEETSSVIT